MLMTDELGSVDFQLLSRFWRRAIRGTSVVLLFLCFVLVFPAPLFSCIQCIFTPYTSHSRTEGFGQTVLLVAQVLLFVPLHFLSLLCLWESRYNKSSK